MSRSRSKFSLCIDDTCAIICDEHAVCACAPKQDRKEIARKRWGLLAKALKSPLTSQPSSPTDEISMRRFSTFNLLSTEALGINLEPGTRNWYRYSVDVSSCHYYVDIGHMVRPFTAHDLMGFNNTGNICVWPSEEALSYHVLHHLVMFEGMTVLELGGGMSALAGLLVAKYSDAAFVHLTDGNSVAVQNISASLERNLFKSAVSCSVLKWEHSINKPANKCESHAADPTDASSTLVDATTRNSIDNGAKVCENLHNNICSSDANGINRSELREGNSEVFDLNTDLGQQYTHKNTNYQSNSAFTNAISKFVHRINDKYQEMSPANAASGNNRINCVTHENSVDFGSYSNFDQNFRKTRSDYDHEFKTVHEPIITKDQIEIIPNINATISNTNSEISVDNVSKPIIAKHQINGNMKCEFYQSEMQVDEIHSGIDKCTNKDFHSTFRMKLNCDLYSIKTDENKTELNGCDGVQIPTDFDEKMNDFSRNVSFCTNESDCKISDRFNENGHDSDVNNAKDIIDHPNVSYASKNIENYLNDQTSLNSQLMHNDETNHELQKICNIYENFREYRSKISKNNYETVSDQNLQFIDNKGMKIVDSKKFGDLSRSSADQSASNSKSGTMHSTDYVSKEYVLKRQHIDSVRTNPSAHNIPESGSYSSSSHNTDISNNISSSFVINDVVNDCFNHTDDLIHCDIFLVNSAVDRNNTVVTEKKTEDSVFCKSEHKIILNKNNHVTSSSSMLCGADTCRKFCSRNELSNCHSSLNAHNRPMDLPNSIKARELNGNGTIGGGIAANNNELHEMFDEREECACTKKYIKRSDNGIDSPVANISKADVADAKTKKIDSKNQESPRDDVYDVILSADCLFFDDSRKYLIETLWKYMGNQSVALLMAPKRGNTLDLFVSHAATRGFQCEKIYHYNEDVWRRHLEFLKNPEYEEDIHYPILLRLTKR